MIKFSGRCTTLTEKRQRAIVTEIGHSDESVIPSTSDAAAFSTNASAIDQHVSTDRYHHIIAWGKWLGFTPKTVEKYLTQAVADDAPADSVQKIDGQWVRLGDVGNETNRKRVDEIATNGYRGR